MSTFKKCRKKPIEVEYREVEPLEDVYPTIYKDGKPTRGVRNCKGEIIHTLEGDEIAIAGEDYIIKGVKGEMYPIKKDIFEQTYDMIVEEPKKERSPYKQICPNCGHKYMRPLGDTYVNPYYVCPECGYNTERAIC